VSGVRLHTTFYSWHPERSLAVRQHLHDEGFVSLMDHALAPQVTLSLGALFGQDMAQMALLALEAASTCSFEAFGRSTITFHLWHSELPFNCNYSYL